MRSLFYLSQICHGYDNFDDALKDFDNIVAATEGIREEDKKRAIREGYNVTGDWQLSSMNICRNDGSVPIHPPKPYVLTVMHEILVVGEPS